MDFWPSILAFDFMLCVRDSPFHHRNGAAVTRTALIAVKLDKNFLVGASAWICTDLILMDGIERELQMVE